MKKLIVLVCSFFIISCSSNDDTVCCLSTVIDNDLNITYVDAEGNNLLEGEDAITVNVITVFHKINSEWVEYSEANLDAPKGISIFEGNSGKFLRIFVSTKTDNAMISETKMVFDDGDENIFKTLISRESGNIIVTKVWIDNELKWEASDMTARNFTSVK
ncbi:hypothetical protein [Christiangramia sp. SM2212]|uniref:Lipoprotein n=1 Tax=Christiangramia sediminicola TaxID=3073267 RepID=A0ABU1EM59_9FLAO|nr:hypothetical protein [Christiangramia sp. SM2212]MDR5589074.1 hypothetical protein [Christiangramia sp. SM2212]